MMNSFLLQLSCSMFLVRCSLFDIPYLASPNQYHKKLIIVLFLLNRIDVVQVCDVRPNVPCLTDAVQPGSVRAGNRC
jgi:hypothetical protein